MSETSLTTQASQRVTAIIKRSETAFVKSLANTFGDEKQAIFQREAGWFKLAINKSPQLGFCTEQSLVASLVQVAMTGLTLNPTYKYASLIPRSKKIIGENGKEKWVKDCVFDPSYQGMIYMLRKVGAVRDIYAEPVYPSDAFDYQQGSESYLMHQKSLTRAENEQPVGAFVFAVLPDKTETFEVFPIQEIWKRRAASENYLYRKGQNAGQPNPNSVWVKWQDDMIRKTCIRHIFKRLCMESGAEHLLRAFEIAENPSGLNSENPEDYIYSPPAIVQTLEKDTNTDEATEVNQAATVVDSDLSDFGL